MELSLCDPAKYDALDENYLGWSVTMAPAIVGSPDPPELGDDLVGGTTPTPVLQCTADMLASTGHVLSLSGPHRLILEIRNCLP